MTKRTSVPTTSVNYIWDPPMSTPMPTPTSSIELISPVAQPFTVSTTFAKDFLIQMMHISPNQSLSEEDAIYPTFSRGLYLDRCLRTKTPHGTKLVFAGLCRKDIAISKRVGIGYSKRFTSTNATTLPTKPPLPSTLSTAGIVFIALSSALLGFGLAKSPLISLSDIKLEPNCSFPSSSAPQFGSPEDIKNCIAELRPTLALEGAGGGEEKVSTDPDDLHTHGFSPSDHYPDMAPSVIVYPSSAEDVVEVVKIATKYKVPITVYSGATSLEGQYRGHPTGGICVDMNNMDRLNVP
ncbi:hypothetical protein BDZ97DRAFT_2074975 [Flammula alnicola]|nr:hypothetical protein BDZ97DRAFT_2074975 [Flammula alnicola]